MNLRFTERERAFREECRAWLRDNMPRESLGSGDTDSGFRKHVQWEHMLFDAGWAAVSWPVEFGGRDATLIEWLIFEEEYYAAGAPQRVTQNGIFLLAPTIFEWGTPAQQQQHLRAMARGDVTWAQAWSEPNAGSDLASLKSIATRTGGGWLLSGQKTWSTRASFCDMGYGLFRTDTSQSRHKGLTYFMFPLRADGVTVRGVSRLDGDEGFGEIFLDDVFVADDAVLGGVDRGWEVAMSTTNSERGLTLRSPGRFVATVERLRALRATLGDDDAALDRELIRGWIDAEAYRWFTYASVAHMEQGHDIGPASSMNKVFWSEMDVRLHELGLSYTGGLSELDAESPTAVDGGEWMKGFQFSLAGPIYAGTNEIQRNIIAERVLGLPRK